MAVRSRPVKGGIGNSRDQGPALSAPEPQIAVASAVVLSAVRRADNFADRSRRQILQVADGLWTFLETQGIEPTNNAAERALRQSVIQCRISHGVQSRQGAICRSRLLTVTTSLRQQGRDVWEFLEQAWIAHHRGRLMPSVLPDS